MSFPLQKKSLFHSLFFKLSFCVSIALVFMSVIISFAFILSEKNNSFAQIIIGIALILLTISIVIVIFIIHKLLSPFHTLKQQAQLVGKGDFSTKITLKTGDELEELGDVLSTMQSNLYSPL